MTESAALGVKRHTYMGWLLIVKYVLKRIDKSQYGRCVEAL